MKEDRQTRRRSELARADLDLADSDKQRIAVLKKIAALAKTQEGHAMELLNVVYASGSEALKAKVRRLEAEIALERAKGK